MRFIPTWLHGMLDYPLGLLLVGLPWLVGQSDGGPEMWIPIAAGGGMIVLSALTAYEAGLLRVIPMSGHLMVDAATGALLAASPWLFGFADEVAMPYLALGLGEVGAALTTQTRTGHRLSTTVG
ncbi:MAG TPA: hypothetical protein VEQ85_00730 [Lacipirellulaceae bacterium]|nr:hypothetical protein [Lacipirellulaceae bacterium]